MAYELTYWDKAEIKEWRENSEQEIKEPLASYIASWSAKLADPAVSGEALREENRQPVYRERDYLRLAIAQTGPDESRALEHLHVRLCARYPDVPVAQVQRMITDAHEQYDGRPDQGLHSRPRGTRGA